MFLFLYLQPSELATEIHASVGDCVSLEDVAWAIDNPTQAVLTSTQIQVINIRNS